MPDEFNIADLKLKTSPELTPSEKEYLIANQDQLNDEDKEAYADFLPGEEDVTDPEKVAEAEGEEATEGEGEGEKIEADEKKDFLTRDDMATILADERKKWEAENLSKKETAKKETELKKLFSEDPADWDDAGEKIINAAVQRIKAEQAQVETARVENVNRFISQYNELVKEKKVPSLETEEGQKMFAELDDFGGKFKQTSMQEAYNLYTMIPEDKGGGLKVSADKAKLTAQKQRAAGVGSGRGSETEVKSSGKKYSDIKKPMHEILASALR